MFAGRLFLPFFFAAMAAFTWWYNTGGGEGYLVFPLLAFLPGYEDSLSAQGTATWQMFTGLAVFTSLYALYSFLARDPSLPPPR